MDTPDNFLGIPDELSSYATSRTVIFSIPFDGACSWQRGAAKGPAAIVSASQNLELWDIESGSEPVRTGIFTAPPLPCPDQRAMLDGGLAAVRKYLNDGKFVIALGGDHSVSWGPLKAHAEKYPKMSILHLDAHLDRRPEYHGDPHSHASIIARAQEFVPNIVSVGIRTADQIELKSADHSRIHYAERLDAGEQWMNTVLSQLGDEVYVTFDVDVFDPSIMPATGTPEPGGLTWYTVIKLLKRVAQEKKLIGADIVELMPQPNPAPDFMIAKLVYKIISYTNPK